MKHLKLFFALFAMLALGVGNAWAETVEFDLTTKTQLTTQTANSVVFTNGGATLTITKSASGTAVNNYMPGGTTNASHTRVYKTNPITFDVGTGNKIQSVTVKVTSSSGAIDQITNGTWNPTVTKSGTSSPITYTLSTTSQTASVTPSGTSRIEKVTLTYVSEGGSTPEPEPDPTPEPGGEVASYTWDLTKASYSTSNTSQVTWSATDVNMVLTKESSTTDANNYLGGTNAHTRVYKDQKITFTPAANVTITSIEIVSTSTDYAGKFKSSTWSNATAAASGSNVTITPSNGANAIICTITAATRASKVTVNYTKAASGEPEPVIVKTLESIAVTGMKTTYEQGDIFKFNGTCTATYSVTKDGVAQAVETAEVTPTSVSTPNMNTVGTQTIEVTYETVSTTYDITITENEVTPGTYNVLLDNVLWNVVSGQQAASVESMSGKANDITFYTTKGSSQMYANATQTRFYKDQTFTISVPEGYLIKSIIFAEPASDNKWDGSITVNTGTYTDGTKTWTGSAQEVTYTFGAQNRIANAEITYEVAPVEPTKTLTSIDITTAATQTTFWQGETFNHTGLVVTAHFDGAEDEVVTPTVNGSTATAGTQTVTVSYTEGTVTKTATYTIEVKAIPNTKETAYTVADAYDIIDKLTTAEGVFISGIISQVDSYNDTYKSITYWISTDGTTTKQLQVYSGKGLESADFTAVTDLTVGDQVIICGNLKKYSGTYEFDKNNYLASHTPTTKDPAGLEYATTEYTANVGEAFATPVLTNPNGLTVTYSTSDASKATVDASTGEVTIVAEGTVTITASTTGDATHDAGSASYTITISDPSKHIAQLPFTYNSGKAAIETTAGITHSGLGSDYTTAGVPPLKFDTEGDYVIVRYDQQAGEFSFVLKQNGQTAGTFTVYESANGEDYTPVWTGGDLGNAQSATITPTLAAASRYVKFEYTTKPSGTNYGLGSISIQKPDLRKEAGIAWSAETTTITIGDAFTAPTLSNPNGLTLTCTSDNDALATVTNAGVITLKEGVTGKAVITATFTANENYKGAEVTTTIYVNPKTDDVVILAKYNGQWYAMMAEYVTDNTDRLAAVAVNYVGGKLYNVSEEDKAAITWKLSVNGGNATFQNGTNYLVGSTSTTLSLNETAFDWAFDGSLYLSDSDSRTFIYHKDGYFRNYAKGNPENYPDTYSTLPVVTAPVFVDGQAYGRSVNLGTDGYRYGTICLPFGSTNFTGAEFFECVGKEKGKVYLGSVTTLVAGIPYIFLASATEVAVYGDGTTAATPGSKNGLVGTFTNDTEVAIGNYILKDNELCQAEAICWVNANRAYLVMEDVPGEFTKMPGRRYIGMDVEGENEATGFENITAPADKAVKAIINGQLIIIRDGEMYNAMGVRL